MKEYGFDEYKIKEKSKINLGFKWKRTKQFYLSFYV